MSACTCGHSVEEHGQDAAYPRATECTECSCIAYEADADEEADASAIERGDHVRGKP